MPGIGASAFCNVKPLQNRQKQTLGKPYFSCWNKYCIYESGVLHPKGRLTGENTIMDKKQKVLFLCTGNSARSQMAEGFLRSMAGDHFEPLSAGMEARDEIHPMAVQVMREIDIDISNQRPKGLEEYLGKELIHFLIVVCNKANETCPRIWPGLMSQENRYYWPFDDPAEAEGTEEKKLNVFRRVRDEIKEKIAEWVKTH